MLSQAKFFIGGLNPLATTTETLRQYFESFAPVVDAIVMVKDGRSRGFGFVTFVDPNSVPADFVNQVHVIDGKQVDVKPAVPEVETSMCKLFVGGLAPMTDTARMQEYFSQFGSIVDVVAMVENGQPRGFGFVEFSTPEEATLCLSHGSMQDIDGKMVEVKFAEPRGSAPAPQGRGGYGAPFSAGGYYGSPYGGYGAPYGAPYASALRPYGGSQGAAPVNTAKIFVGGLTPTTGEPELTAYFTQYGNIESCEIMRREGGTSRGFGFITFSSPEEAAAAMAPHYHVIDDKRVEVKGSLPKGTAPPAQRLANSGYAPYGGPSFYAAPFPRGYMQRGFAPRYRPY